MDSLTQIALGSAVGVAVLGRRTSIWKAALWGGLCGTLPDLDSFIDHGDPIRNMTFHRAESHALFYLTLAAPAIAWIAARVHGEMDRFRRWWLAVWLALVTHPLLDVMTVYGTQLALPFTDHPFGVGSIFIIDPLYTIPLLVGVIAALTMRNSRGLRWNSVGLVISSVYLAWSFAAQQYVVDVARNSLDALGVRPNERSILVTPGPFNTVLWRVVVVTPDEYMEGFYSLLDRERVIHFDAFPRRTDLYRALQDEWHVARIAWFSHGFFKMSERDGRILISDLRMGLEPNYTFTFAVARRNSPTMTAIRPEAVPVRYDLGSLLSWMWRRLQGEPLPSPRP